ncbi:hypothetical protein HDU67_004728, partial [Dinochytrium kinnereticum]
MMDSPVRSSSKHPRSSISTSTSTSSSSSSTAPAAAAAAAAASSDSYSNTADPIEHHHQQQLHHHHRHYPQQDYYHINNNNSQHRPPHLHHQQHHPDWHGKAPYHPDAEGGYRRPMLQQQTATLPSSMVSNSGSTTSTSTTTSSSIPNGGGKQLHPLHHDVAASFAPYHPRYQHSPRSEHRVSQSSPSRSLSTSQTTTALPAFGEREHSERSALASEPSNPGEAKRVPSWPTAPTTASSSSSAAVMHDSNMQEAGDNIRLQHFHPYHPMNDEVPSHWEKSSGSGVHKHRAPAAPLAVGRDEVEIRKYTFNDRVYPHSSSSTSSLAFDKGEYYPPTRPVQGRPPYPDVAPSIPPAPPPASRYSADRDSSVPAAPDG